MVNYSQDSPNEGIVFFGIGTLGRGIIITVITFIVAGSLAVYLPKIFKWDNKSWEANLSFNVGTAFFASAILTCTLDLASQSQRRKDFKYTMEQVNKKIQEIRETSVDQLLEDLSGDKLIFQEIKSQIIKKNYIRNSFSYQIRFEWLDKKSKRYLKKLQTAKYIVKNLASKSVTYNLHVMEEKEYCDLTDYKDTDTTQIKEVSYQIFSGERTIKSKQYTIDEIQQEVEQNLQKQKEKFEDKVYDLVEFKKELVIPENCIVKVETTVESIVESQLRYPLISLVNSTGMEIDITHHPEDLVVVCYPIHPNFEKLEIKVKDLCTKRWILNCGIFPGQGIQLEWKAKNSKPLDGGNRGYLS